MTTPTPGFSSPAPNTVIGTNPLSEPIHDTLWAAIHGHNAIVGAIVNHAEHDQLTREIRRQEAAGAVVPRGEVGGTGGRPESAAAGS
jgi:hypothetical protein